MPAPATEIDTINDVLMGFTDLVELTISSAPGQSRYDLALAMGNGAGGLIRLRCADVTGLSVVNAGGGLCQFLVLRCWDRRADQNERVGLHFADIQGNAIAFSCASAQASRIDN